MENFYFVSDHGKTTLPTKQQLTQKFKDSDERVVLVLDSSVCLDIINLIRHKKDAKCDKTKIFNLIEYAQKNNIKHFMIFALLELCYDKETFKLQSDKYNDYKNMIDYAFQCKIKNLRAYKFNYLTDTLFIPKTNIQTDAVKLIVSERINVYYLALLKISIIAQKGLQKGRAEKNVEEFVDWMENDLKLILGPEYIFALAIFGGNNEFRTMIKLGAAKDKVFKATWGTAWDLLHGRMSVNKEQMSQLMFEKVEPIFVTKDYYLYSLISPVIDTYTTFGVSKLSIIYADMHTHNYSGEFLGKLDKRLLNVIYSRNGVSNTVDPEKIILKIKELENCII